MTSATYFSSGRFMITPSAPSFASCAEINSTVRRKFGSSIFGCAAKSEPARLCWPFPSESRISTRIPAPLAMQAPRASWSIASAMLEFCCLCRQGQVVASQFFKSVLGGTAALHVHRAWGAVLFCRRKSALLLMLMLVLVIDEKSSSKRRTLNAEHPMSNSAGRISWPAALTLVALIVAILIAFLVYRAETWPMRTAHQGVSEAERVAADVKDAFINIAHLQPRIRSEEHTSE